MKREDIPFFFLRELEKMKKSDKADKTDKLWIKRDILYIQYNIVHYILLGYVQCVCSIQVGGGQSIWTKTM